MLGGRGERGLWQAPRPLMIPKRQRRARKGLGGSVLFRQNDALQGGNNLSSIGKTMYVHSSARAISRDLSFCCHCNAFSYIANRNDYILAVPNRIKSTIWRRDKSGIVAKSATNFSRAWIYGATAEAHNIYPRLCNPRSIRKVSGAR